MHEPSETKYEIENKLEKVHQLYFYYFCGFCVPLKHNLNSSIIVYTMSVIACQLSLGTGIFRAGERRKKRKA